MRDGRTEAGNKPVHWMGSSKKDLKAFPDEVTRDMGLTLWAVQQRMTPANAKPLKGFRGADVLEIVDRHDSDTYRVVYTVRFRKAVYVLHAFMKKSKQGIKTLQADIELVHSRLRCAQEDYARRYPGEQR